MRIVTLFTVFVIILFRVLPVCAQENKNYSLSISPQLGIFYGHVEEIVYPPPEKKADLLSQLLWNMKPVFYYGFLMELSPVKPMEKWRFFSDLSFKFSIPGRSGVIEDRDWESVENTGLTGFSSHDNIAKQLILIDFSAGVSFPLRNILLLKTFIHISYMNFNFTGENGHATYARETPPNSGIFAPIDDAPHEYTFNGKVINYNQTWFYVAPGVSLGYAYKEYFRVEISFTISPLIICNDLDEHILTNTQYKDNMMGGIMLEPGLLFSLNLSKRLGISCDVSWRYISRTKGITYRSIDAGDYTQIGKAGAGLSIFNTALLLKVKL